MFEYATMVSSISLTKRAEEATADEIAKEIATSLAKALSSVTKGLETLQGGGWEIISHQMTHINRSILVSFLIRRPRLQKPG